MALDEQQFAALVSRMIDAAMAHEDTIIMTPEQLREACERSMERVVEEAEMAA